MRRLAIIDLVTGHQPMANEDGSVHVVFNGEIYNYRELRGELQARGHHFATASDTETILHAYEEYGVACVDHLDGMFGFALWDDRRERLLLARDPFGIKPLYWTETGDRLLFASEIKALLQDGSIRREVDRESLHNYLTYLYVPSPRTMFAGIRKLPPGHRLIWEKGTLTVEEYWRGPAAYVDQGPRDNGTTGPRTGGQGSEKSRSPVVPLSRSPEVSQILEVLGAAVESQMVADVPLGAFLSGGIDSTLIVALMAERTSRPVQTFSIGFRDAGLYDELRWARIVADRFGTDHHEFVVGPETIELLPRIAWHLDEPLADASAIPNYLLSRMARRFVTVALTGIGGDELFGGYRRYYADDVAARWERRPFARTLARRAIAPALRALPAGGHTRLHDSVRLARKFFEHLDKERESRYVAWNACFTPEAKDALYAPGFRDPEWPLSYSVAEPCFERVRHLPFAEQAMYVDMRTYLPEDPLMMADKMTMANSLESRVPFLDRRVAEFAAALPLSQKMRGRETKVLLRQALRGRVPDELLDRPKHGFGTPIDLWLRRELRGVVARVLAPEVVAERGYFRPEAVQALIRQHQEGRSDLSQHLWALLLLELWHRTYIDRDYSNRPDLTFEDLGLGVGARRPGTREQRPRTTDYGLRTTDHGTGPAESEIRNPKSEMPSPAIRNPKSEIRNPLTILMVSDVDPANVSSGAERMLNEHSTRLAARGHQVVVLTRRDDPEKPEHEVVNGVHLYRHPVRPGNAYGFMRSVLREGGAMFRAIAREHAVDVINVHQPLAGSGVLQVPEASAYPCLYTFLSPWAEEYRIRSFSRTRVAPSWARSPLAYLYRDLNSVARRRMEKGCLDRSQRVMVLSDFSRSQLAEIHGVPAERVSVIPAGVDAERFRPAADRGAVRRELGLPADRFLLLTIRDLEPRMGIDSLLAAMARIRGACPQVHLVIGGTGPLAEPLRAQAKELGLWHGDAGSGKSEIRNPKSEISFTGFIPEERLADYYAAADLFVLPTRYLEGFGLVTIEAMACGTPVVGTPVGGTQEILRGLDPRFLFASPEPDAIAEGILAHLPEVQGNEDLRRRCREYVEENYAWDVVIPRVEALFYQMARKQPPVAAGVAP